MGNLEKGNWPAMDAKNIIASVRKVFEKRHIQYLTKAAYNHIVLHMGFTHHYDLPGFMAAYADLADFVQYLLTSEYSDDMQYNVKEADLYIRDEFFVKEYGKAYCQSVVEANQGIVELALQYLQLLRNERQAKFEETAQAELAREQSLHEKYKIV